MRLPFSSIRKDLLDIINRSENPLSASEIFDKYSRKVDLSTIYRAIKYLETEQKIEGFSIYWRSAWQPCVFIQVPGRTMPISSTVRNAMNSGALINVLWKTFRMRLRISTNIKSFITPFILQDYAKNAALHSRAAL